jgi:hypothetical protein
MSINAYFSLASIKRRLHPLAVLGVSESPFWARPNDPDPSFDRSHFPLLKFHCCVHVAHAAVRPSTTFAGHWPDDDATGVRYRPSKILVTN